MSRKELANKMFDLIREISPTYKAEKIWKAIAETDDKSLLGEYEKLKKEVDK